MPRQILIITNSGDVHADIVATKITSKGGHVFRIDLDSFPSQYHVGMEFLAGRWHGEVARIGTDQGVAIADIGAVWMRKKADFSFLSADLAPQELAFANSEAEHALFSLLYSLDCYWMSHPLALRGALWKGEQLQRAARMGFAVPPSLLTNRPLDVKQFGARQANGLAFKTLSSTSLAGETVAPGDRIAGSLGTTLVDPEDEDSLSAVAELPCFFQHYISKRHELRVTIIGDRLFAARIHSQDDPRTAIDFRDFSAEILYEPARLPAEIERRCLEYVHSYGLTFGVIDIIVTPEGEHVFLENNPVGQFLFVEQLVPELDMTGALAACLMAGAEGCDPCS